LKTPITVIRGRAQLMLGRISKQPERSAEQEGFLATLEKIDQQAQRLTSLINDLLDINSIRTGRLKLQLKREDLVEVCREVVAEQRLLTERAIRLEAHAAPVLMLIDRDRLGQVLTNLVSNALKYSPEGTPVEVHVHLYGDTARILVCDGGPGIPEEQRALIFEPFYRAPGAQDPSKRGWGLGLAICKEIVEQHGGRIWCESTPGAGSTFLVELPLAGKE